MDVLSAAPGPALALGIAVALGVLAAGTGAGLLLARPGPSRRAAAAAPPGVVLGFPHDDLPAFRERPPGFPGAGVPGSPAPAGRPVPAPAGRGPIGGNPVRVLTAMVLAALVLAAAAAVVAWAAEREGTARAALPADAPAAATTTAAGPSPAAMSVPAAPAAGQPGAGALADVVLPGGRQGVSADLVFGAVLLEQRAVGVTVAYPHVAVTAAGDGTALAHVRFDPWNCLTAAPPPDPVAAGCVRAAQEYADLPAPALAMTRDDGTLRVAGRFPTYTRPAGRAAAYTGRVYDLVVTVRPGSGPATGPAPADGRLVLGGRGAAVDDPALSLVQLGG